MASFDQASKKFFLKKRRKRTRGNEAGNFISTLLITNIVVFSKFDKHWVVSIQDWRMREFLESDEQDNRI